MKILLLIDSLGAGGAQRQMVNLALGLDAKGAEITILTYHPENHYKALLESKNIDLLYLKKTNRFSLQLLFGIMRIIGSGDFEVCCSFLFTPSFYLLTTKPIYPKLIRVVSERTCERLVSKFDRLVTRKMYYFAANAVSVNSFHQYNCILKKEPGLKSKIKNIPNGVDTNEFYFRRELRKGEWLTLLAIGKVSRIKNPEVVINALRILRDEMHLIVHCHWLGPLYEWVESQSAYYESCKKLITKFELNNQWQWLGKRNDVNKILATADLLVHPSFGEGFPNVVCEALATGTPVIASSVYDHPRIVEENVNGFLFDPDSAVELADKIFRFQTLSDHDKRNMRINANTSALTKFSNQKMIDSYWNLFQQLKNINVKPKI